MKTVFLLGSCILLIGTLANNRDAIKYRYELSVVSLIQKADHEETWVHNLKNKPKYVCELPDEKRLELCREAWKLDYFRDHGYKLLQNETVGPDTVYRMFYYADKSCCEDRIENITSAFECSASPPYYLQQGPTNETVYVTVATDTK